MRRGLLVVLCLALIGTSMFGLAGTTGAHPVTVDGNTNEWKNFGTGPTEDNTAHIARNTLGQGEFIWLDQSQDQRIVLPPGSLPITATATFTKEVDIKQVRVTGDRDNLSMYVSMSSVTRILSGGPGSNLPQLQIAIDTGAGGNSALVSPATITPTVAASWEYLLKTQFNIGTVAPDLNSNSAPVLVYKAGATPAVTPTTLESGLGVIQKIDNSIELQVPWADLGFVSGPPTTPLRFTVVALRSNGDAANPSDGVGSNILDTLTPLSKTAGSPTGVANTRNELSNGVLDYSFEVGFDQLVPTSSSAPGEVYSPLLITEVGLFPRASSIATDGDANIQWIEITNVSGATVLGSTVNTFKIGDATQRTSNEGMLKLPSTTSLAPNQSLIVTRDKNKFQISYPSVPLTDVYATAGLTPATNWAGTNLSLKTNITTTLDTISDQIVLLDGSDTIADLVEYTNVVPLAKSYPDHSPVLVPTTTVGIATKLPYDTSIQRCPGNRDTNNRDAASPDWIVSTLKSDQTPLTQCLVADVAATVAGPQNVVVSVTAPVEQSYTINYVNNRLNAAGVIISDTLPTGMTYKAGSSNLGEPTVNTVGGRTQLVWNVGTVGTAGIGQITFVGVVPQNTPAGSSSHDVSISTTTREVASDMPNNVSSLPVTYTTEAVVDLTGTKSVVTTGASASKPYPGGQITYHMTYVNNGAKAASGVTLVDTIPAGLTYVNNSKGFAADTSVPGKLTLAVPGTLAANGGNGVVDVVFAVNEALTEGTVIDANSITVATTTTPELNTANNIATSDSVTLIARPPAADLSVTTTVKNASNAKAGGTIVYTINYANNGEKDAFGVTLVDVFPASLEYSTNSQRLTPDQSVAGQLTFSLPPLTINSSGSIDITFNVKSDAVGGTKVSTMATIATTSDEAPTTNNTSTSPETTLQTIVEVITHNVYLPVVRK